LRLAELRVNRSGIYRLTYEALLAARIDASGVRPSELALTNHGAAVPIRVVSADTFWLGSYIEFIGDALDTIYTDTNVYTLWLDPASAQRIAEDVTPPNPDVQPPSYYMETALVNRPLRYSFSAPGADPWYDTPMLAYRSSPKTWNYTVNLDNVAPGVSTLAVGLFGATNFASAPDHHVAVKFNATPVADEWFDGAEALPITADLATGSVLEGTNTLTVEQPADLASDVSYDKISLDRWSVTYPRAFVARQGGLSFTADRAGVPGDGATQRQCGGLSRG